MSLALGGGRAATNAGIIGGGGGGTGGVVTGLIVGPCSGNVFTNGIPSARAMVDLAKCSQHPAMPQPIVSGSSNVFINGSPAARLDDKILCGAVILSGSGNVFIGSSGGSSSADATYDVVDAGVSMQNGLQKHVSKGTGVDVEGWLSRVDGKPLTLSRGSSRQASLQEQTMLDTIGKAIGIRNEPTSAPIWNKEQTGKIAAALNDERRNLHQRLHEIERWNADDRAHFKASFGVADEEARGIVKERLVAGIAINGTMGVSNFEPGVQGRRSANEWAKTGAYVKADDSSHKFYVGPAFFKVDSEGRALMVAHEISHFRGSGPVIPGSTPPINYTLDGYLDRGGTPATQYGQYGKEVEVRLYGVESTRLQAPATLYHADTFAHYTAGYQLRKLPTPPKSQ